MDVGGTVMGEELGGRIKRSVRHRLGRQRKPVVPSHFLCKKEKKNYLEQGGSGTKLLSQEQSLLGVLCPLNQSLDFFAF